MKFNRMLSVIDSHTAGEAARIVIGGIPKLEGNTIAEEKQYLIDHHDDLRKSIMLEPRGHSEMFGAFLVPENEKLCPYSFRYKRKPASKLPDPAGSPGKFSK